MDDINVTKEQIVETLYGFITKHFDNFKHFKGKKNWWENHKYPSREGESGNSWSPFIHAFFIIFGKEKGYEIGASYTYEKGIKKFIENIDESGHEYQKPFSRYYDVSWHDSDKEFILGLEHEETGSTIKEQLKSISDEIEKLRSYKGKFKIIVARPRISKEINDYESSIEHYKENIEKKLIELKCLVDEDWIIILIAPRTKRLYNSKDQTEILYRCYFLNKTENGNNKELKLFFDKIFSVTMNEKLEVRLTAPIESGKK